MRIRSTFLFLLGDRESVLELAYSRWTLLVGSLLVLSAGLARNYDGEDLVREPWHLLGPFGASIVTSLGLFLLFKIIARMKGEKKTWGWAGLALFPRFLGLYWMTAPLAWLYAIPYERMLTPVGAVEANLWTLAVVATWRVVLMARVLSVLLRTGFWPVLAWTLFYGAGVMVIALNISSNSVLDLMGGLRMAPADLLLAEMMFNVTCGSLLSLPGLLIAALVSLRWLRPLWPPAQPVNAPGSPRAAIVFGAATIVAWVPALLVAQPEQRLRCDVEEAWARGQWREGIAIMSAHRRNDFPMQWRLPPEDVWTEKPTARDAIREAIDLYGAAPWVVEWLDASGK